MSQESTVVKLGGELRKGKLGIVMGREQADKTRTIAIVPLESTSVRLLLLIKGNQVRGQFRTAETNQWHEVGQCDLPELEGIVPKLSLQFYQGAADVEHWARASDFRISRMKE